MRDDRVSHYTARPLAVRAIRWTGDNFEQVEDFVGTARKAAYDPERQRLYVWTAGGAACVLLGDWIVVDHHRDVRVFSELMFRETYAPAEVDHHPV